MVPNPRLPEASSAERLGRAASLEALYGSLEPQEIIARSLEQELGGIAAVSSFGADSAVLLHMIAEIDRHLPVIFLDTGKHFGETMDYRDALVADLGLTNLQVVSPKPELLAQTDPDGNLHQRDTNACCDVRKVEPMARAVHPYGAWFTGRKRFQSTTRAKLNVFEEVGPRLRINPMARWGTSDLAAYMRSHRLRENPLVAYGYLSIGCFPCTQPVKPGEDPRSGRWAGQSKTECGIHLTGLEQSLTASSL
jgi:phosphoadenosine phosphosulfate reductase